MAGYKSYRKSKVKNYQRGGAVSGQTTAAPTGMGRRSTNSPFGTSPGPGEHTTDWSKSQNTSPHRYPGVGIAGGYMYNAPSYAQYPEGWTGSWADLNPPDQPYYQKGGKVGAGSGSGEQTPNAPPGWWSSPSHERWGRRGSAQIYDYWQNAYPPDPRTPQPYYGWGFGDNPPDAPPFAKGGKVGAGPGSGEQTPREPVFDWSKRVGTTPGYAHWGGVGRAQMLGPTTMGGYAGGPASMDQYYGWGQPNPPDAPLYKKGGKVGTGPGSGEHTPDMPYQGRVSGVGGPPGSLPPTFPIHYPEGWTYPPDQPLYKKGGKVMDQYLDGKKKNQVKKKDKVKAMTKTSKKEVKTIPKEKPMKKATKEGGVELIKSMRGMTFRQLKDLNKKMVRG